MATIPAPVGGSTTTSAAVITRHPVLTYFVLAFAISWGGLLLAVGGPDGLPGTPEETAQRGPAVLLAMLAGPTAAGLLVTGVVDGRAGFRDLRARLLRWRVGAGWYAVALLTLPLAATATLLALALRSPAFLPGIVAADDKAALVLLGLAFGLAAGVFEELGWTGFAIPRLRRRCRVLATGLGVGVVWAAWHVLLNVWASGTAAGTLSLVLFLPQVLSSALVLPTYRVLMVWVYDRTGSLPVAMVMHLGMTGGSMIVRPLTTDVVPGVVYALALTAALWAVVAAVAMANGGQLTRAPRRTWAA